MTDERDARLSALLDGALSAPEEAALREEIARDPELAARLAQLARVDAALRALPARPVPTNLRARLQARLDAETSAALTGSTRPQLEAIRGGAPARPVRRRAWIAGFSAAAAAAAAALVVIFGGPNVDPGSETSDSPQLAREDTTRSQPSGNAEASAEDAGVVASAPETGSETARTDETPRSAEIATTAPAPAAPGSIVSPESNGLPETRGTPDPSALASARDATDSEALAGPEDAAAPPDLAAEERSAPAESPAIGAPATSGALAASSAAGEAAGQAAESALAMPTGAADGSASASARDNAAQMASETPPAEKPLPQIWMDLTDEEALALTELEPVDAPVVTALEWLDALDELEPEAS